eukprot:54432_1
MGGNVKSGLIDSSGNIKLGAESIARSIDNFAQKGDLRACEFLNMWAKSLDQLDRITDQVLDTFDGNVDKFIISLDVLLKRSDKLAETAFETANLFAYYHLASMIGICVTILLGFLIIAISIRPNTIQSIRQIFIAFLHLKLIDLFRILFKYSFYILLLFCGGFLLYQNLIIQYQMNSQNVLLKMSLLNDDDLPIGSVLAFVSDNVPSQYIMCNGAVVAKSNYSELYQIIGSTYGAENDTHFVLPDCTGRMLVGQGHEDNSRNRRVGNVGGEEQHMLTVAEMPKHFHTVYQGVGGGTRWGDSPNNPTWHAPGKTSEEGENQAHNNMPPYLVMNYIIKAKRL